MISFKNIPTPPKGIIPIVLAFAFAILAVNIFSGAFQKGSFAQISGREGVAFDMVEESSVPSMPNSKMGGRSMGAPTSLGYDADMYAEQGSMPIILPPPIPGDGGAGSPDFPAERKIIQNGALSLSVNDVESSAKAIGEIVSRAEGFIESQYISEYTGDQKSGHITLRVPSTKFNETMQAIRLLAVRVTNEQINTNDVSAQYVDLEAQLKSYKVEEEQYQELMKRSGKVSEVLEVARALAQVRSNIERIQGQINYLSRQVSMSSISISLIPISTAKEVTDEWRPGSVIREAFKDLAKRATDLIDASLGFLIRDLPILLITFALFILLFVVFVRLGRLAWVKLDKHTNLPPPSPKV